MAQSLAGLLSLEDQPCEKGSGQAVKQTIVAQQLAGIATKLRLET